MGNHLSDEDQLQEDLILLHRIYPNLNRKELFEAKENLDRYFDLAVRVFLRLEQHQNPPSFDRRSENS